MSYPPTRPANTVSQLTLFSLYTSPRFSATPKETVKPAPSSDAQLQYTLVSLARLGHCPTEIARLTNTPTSTIHAWANNNTIEGFKDALAYGRQHGHCLRVIQAMTQGPARWEELESRTDLDEHQLGRAINTLLTQEAIFTKLYFQKGGKLYPVSHVFGHDEGHDVMTEIRFYDLAKNATFYSSPKKKGGDLQANSSPNGMPVAQIKISGHPPGLKQPPPAPATKKAATTTHALHGDYRQTTAS